MNCVNHGHENGVNTCSVCGEWLCESCSVDINGRIVCKSCVAKRMYDAPAAVADPAPVPRQYSGLLLFICSCVLPGINYMYLGLMKRGLFFISAFFMIAFFMSVSGFSQIGVLIPILWITSFFDGFEKKRRLNSGLRVPDNIDDIKGWLTKYKVPVFIAGVVILAYAVLENLSRVMYFTFEGPISRHMPGMVYHYGIFKSLFWVAVLIGGGYFIMKAFSGKKSCCSKHEGGTEGNDK